MCGLCSVWVGVCVGMRCCYRQCFPTALEYAIRRVQVNQDGLKLNGTHQLMFMLMMLVNWEEVHIL